MRVLDKVLSAVGRVFNPRFAALALVPGLMVILINAYRGGDLPLAIRAGGVQLIISFMTAGIGARIIEKLGANLSSWLGSYVVAGTIGIVLKIAVGWIGHSLNHTPRFWASILAPAVLSTITSILTNFVLRNSGLIRRKWFLAPLRLLLSSHHD